MRWAGRVATACGSDVVAVHCFVPPWSEVSPEDHDRLVGERRAALEAEWTEPATESGAVVRSVVKDGDPRDILLGVARTEDAELVVVGREGQAGSPGFLHIGSVAEHLAHHVDRPLAVVPASGTNPIQRIVIGLDGSAASNAAVQWCIPVAKAFGADVVAVTVIEPYPERSGATTLPRRQRAGLQLAEWTTPLTEAGIAVELVVQGDLHPADGLLGTATARGGDLIVIGTRGLGGFSGLRVGGVAMKVLHRATAPLVLVPATN